MFNNPPLLQLVNSLHFSCRCRRQPVDLSPLPRNVVPKVRDAPGARARHQLETTLQHFPLQLERHQLLRMAPNDSCRGRKQRQRQKQRKQKQQKHQHQQWHHQKITCSITCGLTRGITGGITGGITSRITSGIISATSTFAIGRTRAINTTSTNGSRSVERRLSQTCRNSIRARSLSAESKPGSRLKDYEIKGSKLIREENAGCFRYEVRAQDYSPLILHEIDPQKRPTAYSHVCFQWNRNARSMFISHFLVKELRHVFR